jgi:hypothetical protein
MAPKYEQYESLVGGYEKHPEQGLKATRKKLNKDPNNQVLLVRLSPPLKFCSQVISTHGFYYSSHKSDSSNV